MLMTGSLLDTLLHFCYTKTLIQMKTWSFFHMAPNREPDEGLGFRHGVLVLGKNRGL